MGELIGAVISAAGQIVTSIMAGNQQASAEEKAAKQREIAVQLLQNINDPQVQTLIAPHLDKSAMNDVSTDPRLKDAQMTALQRLQEQGLNGGMTAEDKQMAQDARNQASQYEQGQRGAVMNSFAQRGAGGSGMEMASQLAAQQGGANRMNAMSMDQASNAQRRALQAIQQSGQLAGSIRGQDYGEQADKAKANDAINQLNAGYNQWAQAGNNQNAMNVSNFQLNRGIAQANTRMGAATGLSNAGANQAAITSGIGQAGAQAAGAVGNYLGLTDEEKKRRGIS